MLAAPGGCWPSEQLTLMLPGEQARAAQIRGLRNITTVLVIAVLTLDVALWAAGATGAIVALGGALSVVFALRAGTPPGPYNVLIAQSLLVSGPATAPMAVRILDFAAGAPASTGRDAVYAIVFDFSQQLAGPGKAQPASATTLAA